MIHRSFPVLFLILTAGMSACCHRPPVDFGPGGSQSPITPADIGYVELAGRYNHNVRYFDQLWVRDSITIEWNQTNESGKKSYRSESGDGKFIFVPPRDSVLTVEKLGKVYIWAGSNERRYWMFDLVDGGNEAVYVGSYDALGRPGTRALPIPVRPDSVAYLMGLLPIPVNPEAQDQPAVEMFEGQYFVEPPGLNVRLLIDPASFRPTRVDLLDRKGFSRVTSVLTGQMAVDVEGLTDSELPTICKRAEIYVSGYETRLSVEVDYATTDASRINERVFDFETLMKMHKPPVYINLDGAQ